MSDRVVLGSTFSFFFFFFLFSFFFFFASDYICVVVLCASCFSLKLVDEDNVKELLIISSFCSISTICENSSMSMISVC